MFEKTITGKITDLILIPEDREGGEEIKVIYDYGDEKERVDFVDPELGDIISYLSGVKIKKNK